MNGTQPDWDSLADADFLVRRRLMEYLSAAIGAVNLVDTPEGAAKPPDFWKNRAIRHVMRAQHLYDAWSALVRYKAGQHVTRSHAFRAGDLLECLASETFQSYTPHPDHDRLITSNRETLQEALLLMHSAAHSLGPSVRLYTEFRSERLWFRVRYQDTKQSARTLNDLLEQLGNDWRTGTAAYELSRAQDFLQMNDCELGFARGQGYCELVFSVPVAAASRQQDTAALSHTEDETLTAPPTDDETVPYGEDIRRRFSKRVQANAHKETPSDS